MATPEENIAKFQEIAKRGLQDRLPPDVRARYDEALRRGIIQGSSAPTPVTPSERLERGDTAPRDFTTGERALGAFEAALGLGTEVLAGIPNLTVGGLLALGDSLLRQTSGYGEPTERSAELVEQGSFVPSYSPRSEAGQKTLETAQWALNLPFAQFEKLARKVQDRQLEKGLTGAADATAVQMLPDLMAGLLGLRGANFRRPGDVRRLRKEAEDMGIDLKAPAEVQEQQIANQGENMAGTGMQGIEQVPPAVRNSRRAESERIAGIFKEGKDGGATVASRNAGKLADRVRTRLEGFTYEDLPTVNKTLTRLEELGLPARSSLTEQMGRVNTAQTQINDIMELRKGINRDLPSDINSREYRALSEVKRELDSYLQDAFEKDMINGSPQALARWKEGFQDWQAFKDLYDDNRTIRRIWQDSLSPEQVKRLIFNKSAVNPGADSGTLVRDLKTILGEDSEQFQTLRMTALEDLMKPVTGRDPDLEQFARRWDGFKADNPTLVAELFPEALVKEIDSFADFAEGIAKTSPDSAKNLSVPRIASVFAIGHNLARRAAGVAFGQKIASALMDPGRESKILSNVLGYNVRSPMIPTGVVNNIVATEVLSEQGREFVWNGSKMVPVTRRGRRVSK